MHLKRGNRGVVLAFKGFQERFDGTRFGEVIIGVALVDAADGLRVRCELLKVALADGVHESVQGRRIEPLKVNLGDVVVEGHGVSSIVVLDRL